MLDNLLDFQVANLQRMLCDEERVHEILERALVPQNALKTLHIPNFLPKKVIFLPFVIKKSQGSSLKFDHHDFF